MSVDVQTIILLPTFTAYVTLALKLFKWLNHQKRIKRGNKVYLQKNEYTGKERF